MNKTVKGIDIDQVFSKLCYLLCYEWDAYYEENGLATRELINTTICIKNPRRRILRNPVRTLDEKKFAEYLAKDFGAIDFGVIVSPAIHKLRENKNSRETALKIYGTSLYFAIRGEKLICVANTENRDIWGDLCYAVAFNTFLQEIIFTELKKTYPTLKLGWGVYNISSLFLKGENFEEAKQALKPGVSHLTPKIKIVDNNLIYYTKYANNLDLGQDKITSPFFKYLIECLDKG